MQASICAVDTLIAGPSSTWHRAGSAGSPGTRARGGGVSAETPGSAAGAGRPGEHAGAGVDHDLVHLRVVGPGHLPGQERLGDRDQAVGQVRGRPDRRGRGRRRRRPRRACPRRPAFPRKRPRADHRGRRSAQAARSAFSSTAPCSGGSRNVPDRDPSSSNRQVSRRRTRASGVVRPGDLAVRPGEPLQLVRGHRPGQLGQPRLGRRGRRSGSAPAPWRTTAARRRTGPGSPAGPAAPAPPGHAPAPYPTTSGTSTTATARRTPSPSDAQPRRASKSPSRTRNRHVAAARCPASSQICASTRSSGTRAGSAGDAATSAGGETAAKIEPGLSVSNMYSTLTPGSDKTG